MYVCIFKIDKCTQTHTHMYIHIEKEREGGGGGGREGGREKDIMRGAGGRRERAGR